MKRIKTFYLYRDFEDLQQYIITCERSLKFSRYWNIWLGDSILTKICPEIWHAICPDLPRLEPGAGPREIELTIKFKETSDSEKRKST